MNETVKRLLMLQELNITLKEAAIVHGDDLEEQDTTLLNSRVAELRLQIPPELLSRYDRLSRQGLAVVKIHHGMCLGCNIGIARGDINRILAGKLEPVCPHCGKFVINE